MDKMYFFYFFFVEAGVFIIPEAAYIYKKKHYELMVGVNIFYI